MASEEPPPQVLLGVPRGRGPEQAGFVAVDAQGDETVTMTYDDLDSRWVFHVEGKLIRGQAVITHLGIEPSNPDAPESITVTKLRKIPLGTILERVKRALRVPFGNRVSHLLGDVHSYRPKQGRSWPPEHYMQVAWYYTYAESTGRAPRKVVADHWKVSLVTASRWIAEARRRGYLHEYQAGIRLGRDVEYEHADASTKMHQTNAEIERRIFLKVFREQIHRAVEQAESGQALQTVAQLLTQLAGWTLDETTGGADGADLLRSTIFLDHLAFLAERWPREQGRTAAATLLAALRDEQLETSGHSKQ